MRKIRIEDIKPGMILAQQIISPRGQLLADVGSTVTAQQLLHVHYYQIDELWIQDEKEASEKYDLEAPDEFIGETQSWRIVNSQEFKEFKKSYEMCAVRLEDVINSFLRDQLPLDDKTLLKEIRNLFERHSTGMGMMAMLVNMQGIDTSTYKHSVNVAIIARVFGAWLGIEDPVELDVLAMCGLYHDIGKSLVPNTILTKPGELTVEEYARMCEHPLLGYTILQDQSIDRRIKMAALQHHERGDGSGYPYGLKKEFITEFAKIIAIADVYDAMTADRCYRAGICPFEVIAEFQRQNMEKYDPKYLTVFLENIAYSYIGSGVLLSDGTRGVIAMIQNDALAMPLIKTETGSFVNLEERQDLYIRACV